MLKKLFKGILWLVVLLAVAGLLFVWQGLGVNPLEGDADNIWDLVSNQVDFFARFPGTDVLREPVVEGLGEEEGFEWITRAKDALADAAFQVAREANPQVPLGLFEIDLENDLRGKEVAIAGLIRGPNFAEPRLDRFVALVRIPGYAKFISALRRDFVRSKIPDGDRISVVKGTYFKVKDPALVKALAPFRSGLGRDEPDALWFARIRDVLLLTDEPMWIEDALRGGGDTLPADVDFKIEFIPISARRSAEMLIRPALAQSFVHHLGRLDRNSALYYVSRIVPMPMVGNVIVQASPRQDGIGLKLLNHPLQDGYGKIGKPHLVKLYEREKADLRFDFTENGIGRLLPRKGVAGALVIHADADTFASTFVDVLPESDRRNLDDVAAQGRAGGRAYATFEALLQEIGKELADTHMLVVHRPAVFDKADFSTPEIGEKDATPQPSFSLVSAVRDNASPDRVVEKISQNLKYLGLEQVQDPQGVPQPLKHPSGKFYVADPQVRTGDMTLLHPAYAAITEGGRYFVFTSSVENMEAILAAAHDPEARMLAEPGFVGCVEKLPAEGTLSILARGPGLRNLLGDRVRVAFVDELNLDRMQTDWRARHAEQGIKDEDELDRLVEQDWERYRASEYPVFRDTYRRRLAPLGALDTVVLGISLGVGASKMVTGEGYLLAHQRASATE